MEKVAFCADLGCPGDPSISFLSDGASLVEESMTSPPTLGPVCSQAKRSQNSQQLGLDSACFLGWFYLISYTIEVCTQVLTA